MRGNRKNLSRGGDPLRFGESFEVEERKGIEVLSLGIPSRVDFVVAPSIRAQLYRRTGWFRPYSWSDRGF